MGTTATGRPRNRSWPEALKREIVAASFAPGSSVSIVARQYDVNANQVFNWRKRYSDDPRGSAVPSAPQLIPVLVTADRMSSPRSHRLSRRPSRLILPASIVSASAAASQFLNQIGARALRIQLDRILEMAESSPDRFSNEKKIVQRFGGQHEFELVVPPSPEMQEAAN